MPQLPSPFSPGRPLRADQPLYGRDETFRFIHGQLATFGSINLVGERRMGKTSVLHHLLGNPDHCPPPGDPTLLLAEVDFQNNVTDKEGFYGLALREILRNLPAHGNFADAPARLAELDSHPAAEYAEFDRWLRRLKQARLARPVLLVDEFEHLLDERYRPGFPIPQFYEGLRSLLTADRLALVVASRLPLIEHFARHPEGMTSTFPSYLAPVILDELDEEQADKVVLPLFDLTGDLGTVQAARHWAGRHPCRLQCAGDALFRAHLEGKNRASAKREYELAIGSLCTVPKPLRAAVPAAAGGGPLVWLRAVLDFPASVGRAVMAAGSSFGKLGEAVVGLILIVFLFWLVYGLANGQLDFAEIGNRLAKAWEEKP